MDIDQSGMANRPAASWAAPAGWVAAPGVRSAQTSLVFCVPPNDVLLGYWDRVADRLVKTRNCINLGGVRRSLALFAELVLLRSLHERSVQRMVKQIKTAQVADERPGRRVVDGRRHRWPARPAGGR